MNLPLQLSLNWSVPHWKVSRPCLVPCSGRVSHFPLVLAVDLLVGDGQSDLQEAASTRTYKNPSKPFKHNMGVAGNPEFQMKPKVFSKVKCGFRTRFKLKTRMFNQTGLFWCDVPSEPGTVATKGDKRNLKNFLSRFLPTQETIANTK